MEILRAKSSMMRRGEFVYALLDPDTEQIRYIGKTHNLYARYYGHIHPSKRNHTPVTIWVRGLCAQNKQPLLAILEHVDRSHGIQEEHFWIYEARNAHGDLLNVFS
jgi:hypothetical protein